MKSRWRRISTQVIVKVLEQCDNEGITDRATLEKRISAAYPFGQRKYHPYKMWLQEVKWYLDQRERVVPSVRNYWIADSGQEE